MRHALLAFCVLLIALPGAAAAQSGDKAQDKDDFTMSFAAVQDKVFVAAAQVAAMNWNVTHSDKHTGIVSPLCGSRISYSFAASRITG